jgi:long-chain acyl-CoA synthetase
LRGVPIGYSTANTLLNSSSKIMRGSKGDATVLLPTVMTAVPLILDRITKAVHDKVQQGTPLQKALFELAYNYKAKWVRRGLTTPMIDALVFKKIAEVIGGNLRVIVSGGAPLSPETQEFIRVALCTHVVQGYGLTETTGKEENFKNFTKL